MKDRQTDKDGQGRKKKARQDKATHRGKTRPRPQETGQSVGEDRQDKGRHGKARQRQHTKATQDQGSRAQDRTNARAQSVPLKFPIANAGRTIGHCGRHRMFLRRVP
jgi:hypothetical protein